MKANDPIIFTVMLIALNVGCVWPASSQHSTDYLNMDWKAVATGMPSEWYRSEEARMTGDSVLKYQTDIGGWAKNSDFHNGGVKQNDWKRIVEFGIGATFDNGATLTEMKFLTKIYTESADERYRDAFLRAYNYILMAQYPNGGWPQFYPCQKITDSYSSHITFNDDAMVNIMRFLGSLMNEENPYASMQINPAMKELAGEAFYKGVECILNTQIVVDGKPTVWCAQHDEFTLEPAKARSYELPSYSGQESAGITLLLMDIENPSKEVIAAIEGAVQWFEDHRISGLRVERYINEEGEKDKVVVEDTTAPDLWARFYDLETGKPYFCDRDGIKKKSLDEIGIERRRGYSWYTSEPDKVIQSYPEWARRWGAQADNESYE
jgi:pectinesterase